MNSGNIISDCGGCTCGWINFDNLTKEELKLVNDNRYEAHFKAGEIIFKQGAPTSNAVFLVKGLVKMYIEGPGGRNFILGLGTPGNLIAGPASYVNSRYSYTVAAITDLKACFIDFAILKSLVLTNPKFAEGFIVDVSTKSLKSHSRMFSLTQKRMHGRLAEALLFLSESIFHAEHFNVLLTRQELGEYTNMAKESVVRILHDLEEEGIIKTDGSVITILDKEKLEMISEKG